MSLTRPFPFPRVGKGLARETSSHVLFFEAVGCPQSYLYSFLIFISSSVTHRKGMTVNAMLLLSSIPESTFMIIVSLLPHESVHSDSNYTLKQDSYILFFFFFFFFFFCCGYLSSSRILFSQSYSSGIAGT